MTIAVLILATWRLSSLLAQEAGPGDMFVWVRRMLGVWYDDAGDPQDVGILSDGITCVWCNSVWIGGVLAAVYWLAPDVAFWLALPFALSAGAIVVHEVVEWRERVQ
jgi:hypothetical protein